MLKFFYTLFLGLLLVIFVGMGVAVFYPEPKAPAYPPSLQTKINPETVTPEEKRQEDKYQRDSEAYGKKTAVYNRNVSIITLIAAVVLLMVSLLFHARITILADGLLLGGTFTLIYSIGRSFASENAKYSFVVVTIGLIITMVMGYLKFIKPQSATAAAKKKQ